MDKSMVLFENLLMRIDRKLPFLGMTPINEPSEHKKFFKQKDYNPLFRYKKPATCDKLFREIDDVELDEGIISRLLMQRLEKFKRTNAMLQNLGKQEFTYFSKGIFGKPSQELVAQAYEILKNPPEKDEDVLDGKKVMGALKKAIADLELKEWKTAFKPMASYAAVLSSKKMIYLKRHSKFPQNFIKRMIVHEIGAHVFRAVNGEQQPYKIFFTGLPNYMMTEEGLAVNIEEMYDCLKTSTLRAYAGRTIAINLSLQNGFRNVFNELRQYFDDDSAWKLVLRAKRGLIDTSKPGAYTKDHLYLEGYYRVKKFLAENKKSGLKKLYYGRIDTEQVNLLDKIMGLKEPDWLPDSAKFKAVIEKLSSER